MDGDIINTLTLGLGAAWASGINLYATVLVLGVLDLFDIVTLPEGLQVVSSPTVLMVAAVLYIMEFIADKIPGVDSIWDGIHTFIRIPAGAMLAYGAMGGLDGGAPLESLGGLFAEGEFGQEATAVMALLGGGTIAAGTHATKAASRAVINLSPEPFTNWLASLAEDALVIFGIYAALVQPLTFLIGFAVFAAVVIWLLPKLWRGIRGFFSRVKDPVGAARGRYAHAGYPVGGGPAGPPSATGGDGRTLAQKQGGSPTANSDGDASF